MTRRQQVLILWLGDSSLDARVVAWARWDGTGRRDHMAGDEEEPPYETGLHALRDGWRLFQYAPLRPEAPGEEFRTSYLKYEFAFERWEEA